MPVSDDFDEYFTADFPLLVGFLCKLGFEIEAARDAATEAMLDACLRWEAVESPAAWVRRAGSRLAAERVARHETGDDRAGRADRSCPDRHVEDKLIALVESASQVVALLARLPERQRVVLAWSLDGFGTAEIAEQIDLGEADVRSALRDARARVGELHRERSGEDA
ncbi:RNA polymerase subunit sigma [Amycolatopsis antarctica]|uniref:RNA polymerase subunit sigma n=1 Tax=Amycolatopsis antarctica TaxID=1854586 RepID=A0A263D1A9_9PSEU|nr:sigma factor-like helix-turn-helix DNA-binding protein [Amycolatopsis antarctica]OZM71989.1 RNA polymerase subunit sigma [Amycolatopsis antarctica]